MKKITTKAKRLKNILDQYEIKNYFRNGENMYIIGFYDILLVEMFSEYKWLNVKGQPFFNEIHIFL